MLTFSHGTKGVLVGFVGTHTPLHLWGAHARRIGGVGSHVPPGECRITTFREGILQVNTAPRTEAKGGRRGDEGINGRERQKREKD